MVISWATNYYFSFNKNAIEYDPYGYDPFLLFDVKPTSTVNIYFWHESCTLYARKWTKL